MPDIAGLSQARILVIVVPTTLCDKICFEENSLAMVLPRTFKKIMLLLSKNLFFFIVVLFKKNF